MKSGNLFADIPESAAAEIFEDLLRTGDLKLERIVSAGQATPHGEWLDQESHEWVVLLAGSAKLHFEGDSEVCTLNPGDYIHIPAHRRHRVEWTDPRQRTIWLALHYR